MAMQAATASTPTQVSAAEQIQKLREAYADAPEVGRVALDKVRGELEAAIRLRQQQQQEVSTAGRIGLRRGKVSELTGIVKLSPGGAKRLRLLLNTLGNKLPGRRQGRHASRHALCLPRQRHEAPVRHRI